MHGKRPTRKQAEFLTDHRLDYREWLVQRFTPDMIQIQQRYTGEVREFPRRREEEYF